MKAPVLFAGILVACINLGQGASAQGIMLTTSEPLPQGWTSFIGGALAQTPEGLTVFSSMFESEAPLFDDLPDDATHTQLLDVLATQCRSDAMSAEIERLRLHFLNLGFPKEKLFQALRMSVRWEGVTADGLRLVTVFETLHAVDDNGRCGARQPTEPRLFGEDFETRIIRG